MTLPLVLMQTIKDLETRLATLERRRHYPSEFDALPASLASHVAARGPGSHVASGGDITIAADGKLTLPRYAARVYHSANQSIANATNTYLAFNSERWDTHNFHSTTTNTSRITIPADGLYQFGCNIAFATHATGLRLVRFVLNRTTIIAGVGGPGTSETYAVFNVLAEWACTAGAYVEIQVYQSSGAALNVVASTGYEAEFWVRRVSG